MREHEEQIIFRYQNFCHRAMFCYPPAVTTDRSIELGAFTLLRPLAAGGMGEVWRAVHAKSGQPVAVKVIKDEAARRPAFVEVLSDNYNCPSTTTRNAHPDERSLTAAGSRPRNVPGPEAEVVTDAQVRKLMSERDKGATVEVAALKAGVCRRTATKYLSSGKLPSVLPSTRGTVAPRTLLTVRSVPVDLLRAERERPGRRASGSDGRKPAVGQRRYPTSRSGHRCARGGRCA